MASHVARLRNNGIITREHIEETLSSLNAALNMDLVSSEKGLHDAVKPVRDYLENMLRIQVTPTHDAYMNALEAHMDEARALLKKSAPDAPSLDSRAARLDHVFGFMSAIASGRLKVMRVNVHGTHPTLHGSTRGM